MRRVMLVFCAVIAVTASCKPEGKVPDLVPWPKEAVFDENRWPLKSGSPDVAIMLAKAPARQSEVGASLLKDAFKSVGVEVVVINDAEPTPDVSLVICVGAPGENPALARHLSGSKLAVTTDNPGEQGYVIHCAEGAKHNVMLLAGSDPAGTLYACVTAKQLIGRKDGKPFVAPGEVKDWPDIKNRWLGTPQWQGASTFEYALQYPGKGPNAEDEMKAAAEKHVARYQQYVDWLLSMKINGMARHTVGSYTWIEDVPRMPREAARRVNRYALDRGVKAFLQETVNLIPGEAFQASCRSDWWKGIDFKKGTGRGSLMCWSRDDLMLRKGKAIGKYMADTLTTGVWLHDKDTGGYHDPAAWSRRCEECKKRWGDNHAAAAANMFNVFIKGIRGECPGAIVIPILYPYTLDILTDDPVIWGNPAMWNLFNIKDAAQKTELRDKTVKYWTEVTAALPPDAPILIRENTVEAVNIFRSIVSPRPLFTYFEMAQGSGWQPVFSTVPRYLKTFAKDRRDIVWADVSTVGLPTFGASAEYAWNIDGPDAKFWQPAGVADGERPQAVVDSVLPRVCRALWGAEIGECLREASSQNVSLNYINDPDLVSRKTEGIKFKDATRMDQQRHGCEKAVDALDRAWAKLTADKSLVPAYSYLSQYIAKTRVELHAAKWASLGWFSLWRAEELLKDGEREKASRLLNDAIAAMDTGESDLKKVIDEAGKAEDALKFVVNPKKAPGRIYGFNFANLKKELVCLNSAKDAKMSLKWPKEAADAINGRTACALFTDSSPKMDGTLDDAIWQKAVPLEYFVLYPANDGALDFPAAETRIRMLFDKQNIYLGLQCFTNADGPAFKKDTKRDDGALWKGQDSVELFLCPDKTDGKVFQFAVTSQPAVFDARFGDFPEPKNEKWNANLQVASSIGKGFWTAELAIPFADLGATPTVGGAWRILVARNIGKGEKIETSSISPIPASTGFKTLQAYAPLTFVDATDKLLKPVALTWEVSSEMTDKTLSDRVASIVTLKVKIKSSSILHQGKLSAAAWENADNARKVLAAANAQEAPAAFLQWEAPEVVELILDKERDEVNVGLVIDTFEGRFKRYIVVKKK